MFSRHGQKCRATGVDQEEVQAWVNQAVDKVVPHDTQVYEQLGQQLSYDPLAKRLMTSAELLQ